MKTSKIILLDDKMKIKIFAIEKEIYDYKKILNELQRHDLRGMGFTAEVIEIERQKYTQAIKQDQDALKNGIRDGEYIEI